MSFQKCPVCDGRGHSEAKKCHVCNGKGIINEQSGLPPGETLLSENEKPISCTYDSIVKRLRYIESENGE